MRLAFATAVAALVAAPALAGPGDVHEVTADLVNLRAGPSDDASIRDRLEGGAQVIELTRDGGWIGVRVEGTGQQGWIYGELLERVSSADLGSGSEETAGFGAYSQDFDRLMTQISDRLGADLFSNVAEEGSTLTLTLSAPWLRASSQEAQVMAASAVYGMWKAYRDQAPVTVQLAPRRRGRRAVRDHRRRGRGGTGPHRARRRSRRRGLTLWRAGPGSVRSRRVPRTGRPATSPPCPGPRAGARAGHPPPPGARPCPTPPSSSSSARRWARTSARRHGPC
ncbi:MAG: SH3 domain-containing protein [Paracoccaceae bacterium]